MKKIPGAGVLAPFMETDMTLAFLGNLSDGFDTFFMVSNSLTFSRERVTKSSYRGSNCSQEVAFNSFGTKPMMWQRSRRLVNHSVLTERGPSGSGPSSLVHLAHFHTSIASFTFCRISSKPGWSGLFFSVQQAMQYLFPLLSK